MASVHSTLLCIVLLLPGTSLTDWLHKGGPQMRDLLSHSAVAVMNVRTAEKDVISAAASCASIAAGARTRLDGDKPVSAGLGYAVDVDNLGASLSDAGVAVVAKDELSSYVARGASIPVGDGGLLVVHSLGEQVGSADNAIGACRRMADSAGGVLIVMAPNPSPAAFHAFDRLVPVALYGQTIRPGLLSSPSTKTTGLITNTDIAPTVARIFGVNLRGPTYGHAVALTSGHGNLSDLEASDNRWIAQERSFGIRPYVAGGLAILLAVSLLGTWRRSARIGTSCTFVSILIFYLSFIDSAWLLLASIPVAFSIAIYARQNDTRMVRLTSTALVIYLLADATLNHSHHVAWSLLGYSPIEGARYYGLGNEAMGAWVGATVVTAAMLVRRGWTPLAAAVGIAVTVLMGHPNFGAKAGGFLVGGLAIAGFAWGLSGRRFKPLVVIGVSVACLAAGLGGLILLSRFGQSHIDQALANHDGGQSILATVGRKLAMDGHLVFHSVWIWVLGFASAGSWYALRGTVLSDRATRAAVTGGVAATAACLALNDAGVVAAAICSLYLWCTCVLATQLRHQDSIDAVDHTVTG